MATLIGNHVEAAPTAEAVDSLTRLLAWMAHRYRIDTTPGATVVFESRGSNRWPLGFEVTATTISGHRDMANTACPGDSVYQLLDRSMPEEIERLRRTALDEASAELGVERPATEERSTASTISSEQVAVGTDGVKAPDEPDQDKEEEATPAVHGDDDTDRILVSAGATMVITGLAGLIALRRRRIES